MQSLSVLLRQHAGDNNNRNLAAAQANLCVLVTVCRLALVPPWHFNSPVCVCCHPHYMYTTTPVTTPRITNNARSD